jgi:hypothetical protein
MQPQAELAMTVLPGFGLKQSLTYRMWFARGLIQSQEAAELHSGPPRMAPNAWRYSSA